MTYFLFFNVSQLVACFATLLYFAFKTSSSQAPQATVGLKTTFINAVAYIFFFTLFSIASLNLQDTDTAFSLQLHYLVFSKFFFFFFALFTFLLLNLDFNSKSICEKNLFIVIFFAFFFVFFIIQFLLSNHFELLCLLEYLNALLVLFILNVLPSLKQGPVLFQLTASKNFRFLTSFFFLPALLNYFFLMFIVSILLFVIYLHVISELNFLYSFQQLAFLPNKTPLLVFFFLFLLFKLGAAPAHLWKLELFETLRLKDLAFFSTLYFYFFFIFFDNVFLRFHHISPNSVYSLFFFLIIFNLCFVLLRLNSVLNVRQYLLLSSLLSFNLLLLSILLQRFLSQPFFLIFLISYIFTIFLFYFFLLSFTPSQKFITTVHPTFNATANILFFYIPILCLSGAAPSLPFAAKLSFILTLSNNFVFLIFILYLLTIILSVVFYFQLFKTQFAPSKSFARKPLVAFAPSRHTVLFIFIFISISLINPLSFYLLFTCLDFSQLAWEISSLV